jgi:hypothetical protein
LGRSTSGTGNVETITCTAAGRALLDDANAAAQRTTLGITELAAQDPANVDITGGSIVGITDLAIADGGTGASSASDARTNLGLVIGANVLAYDANLQSFVTTFTLPTADSTSGFYLKTDGAGNLGFQAPGGIADGDYGDITVSGGGAVWSIDADTITTTELANNAVETANISDLNVTTGKLADLAVTTAKLNDLSVTAGKIASDAVTTAKILDSNVTTAKIADDAVTNAKLAFDGGAFGFRNKLRNGDFRVNQTGLTYTSTSLRPNNDDAYTLDGWYILSDGNDTIDVSQDTTTIPTNGYAAIALDVETANRKFGIAQIIEARDCVDLIGNTVTLSFKAKVSSLTNLDNVKCAIVAWSGTADSVTSDIVSAWNVEGTNPTLIANATYENTPANLNLTTSYAEYSVTADIDTASAKNIIVFIWSDVTTTSAGEFLYLTDVQLEKGSTATPFERKTYDVELAWAQRFLPVFSAADGADNIVGAGVTATTTIGRVVWHYKRTTRIPPTALLVSSAAHFEYTNGTVRAASAVAFSTAGVDAAQVPFTFGSALTANTGGYAYAVSASARLILTGAEL